MRNNTWMISVRSGTQRVDFLFEGYSLETPQDTYKRVLNNATKLREKYPSPLVTIDVISRLIAFKPRGEKPHKSHYWCPYCVKWRVFLYDEKTGYNHCNICGISDSDFYVRKYNSLWKREMAGLRRLKK
jgi:hypothetical protein